MTERAITVTVDASGDAIVSTPGGRLTAACARGAPGFSSLELLQAALGSCMAASITPLLARHGADAARLCVTVAAKDTSLAHGLAVGITLPGSDSKLLLRCKRAISLCPMLQALNIPVDIHWQMN